MAEEWSVANQQIKTVDMKFHDEKTIYSNGWFLIPLLIAGLTIVYTFFVFEEIPNKIPIHTSFSGEVTYDDKSFGNVLILPLSQLFIIFTMMIVNYIIKHSKQQIETKNPVISKKQNILFRKRWSFFTIISSILMALMFTFLQLTFIYPVLIGYEDYVIFTTIALILLITIFLSVNTGQGGSRIKITDDSATEATIFDDDKYWKLGQFYFNRNDPAIFVEKRFGIGWTNNWARPLSWLILIGIILLPILFIYALTNL